MSSTSPCRYQTVLISLFPAVISQKYHLIHRFRCAPNDVSPSSCPWPQTRRCRRPLILLPCSLPYWECHHLCFWAPCCRPLLFKTPQATTSIRQTRPLLPDGASICLRHHPIFTLTFPPVIDCRFLAVASKESVGSRKVDPCNSAQSPDHDPKLQRTTSLDALGGVPNPPDGVVAAAVVAPGPGLVSAFVVWQILTAT